jgi:hypothetical protein
MYEGDAGVRKRESRTDTCDNTGVCTRYMITALLSHTSGHDKATPECSIPFVKKETGIFLVLDWEELCASSCRVTGTEHQ